MSCVLRFLSLKHGFYYSGHFILSFFFIQNTGNSKTESDHESHEGEYYQTVKYCTLSLVNELFNHRQTLTEKRRVYISQMPFCFRCIPVLHFGNFVSSVIFLKFFALSEFSFIPGVPKFENFVQNLKFCSFNVIF